MNPAILIVDDSAGIRSQLRVAFEAKGAKVLEAENGQEGFWRARSAAIDLILVDVHMPVMDGLDLIRELRKTPEHAVTPIFVLTSDAADMRLTEGQRAGANAWIVKPVNVDLLWKAIERELFGKHPTAFRKVTPGSAQQVQSPKK